MSIYHACDIRGVYGQTLTDPLARKIMKAVGYKLTGKTVIVGGDIRLSTPALMRIALDTLKESGCHVIDIGTIATPVFYHALKELNVDYGVMITASHNPAKYNGFKLVLGPRPIKEAEIKEIESMVEIGASITGQGTVVVKPMLNSYIHKQAQRLHKGKLKIVLDAGNGATSHIAPRLYRELGYEVVELYCQADGTFPNHEPNPALEENLIALGQKVVAEKADLGIAFDGDGDRVGFVDDKGRPISNDYVMVLIARSYLKEGQGNIIYDSKCSMIVEEEVEKLGGTAIIARAGHTFSKASFIDNKALFAGEISGHFFFRELGYDDGMFAGAQIAQMVAETEPLSKLTDEIPKYILSPDIRVPYTDNDKAEMLEIIADNLKEYKPNLIDGVRLKFKDGWGMIRASVTEPLFTLRFEAKTEERMNEIINILLTAMPEKVRTKVAKYLEK